MAVKLGEYVLEKRIGKGGMGQVFLAKQESLDRQVAVKVLPKELAKDETFRARFEREAKAAASLIHPNVVQVYSYGIEKGVPYFAMEFVEGEDLSVKLKRGDQHSIQESIRIVRDVSKALECAHHKGMVHRDIKPSNMMIAGDSSVKVMDFGLAKAARVRTSITRAGMIMGTPPYMSPEQGKGDELDVRSDLYSLGVVFYELLTGTVPFQADTPTAVIYQHIYEKPRPIHELSPDVPGPLEDIVMKLLEKKPAERYSDPSQLLADLDAFETGSAVTASMSATPAGESYPKTLEIDSSVTPARMIIPVEPGTPKALLGGIAGGIVAAVVLIILFLTVWSDDTQKPIVVQVPGETDTEPGPGTQHPGDTQTPDTPTPGETPENKEGLLLLSALRAALPDDVRTVYCREAGEPREKERGLPFEDAKLAVGTYVLTFERPGYRPEELTVTLTQAGSSPSLDEVKISFELTPELAGAYNRARNCVQQEEYSEALLELRRVKEKIPHYKDIDELIAQCNKHLQRNKALDEIFHLGMKYYRDQQWAKAVETLAKLPEDYENASQAFRVLADARDKLKAQNRLQELLVEAQDALLTGDLPRAESSAKSALSIDGANETANLVLTRVIRARELLAAAKQAQARGDYESALSSAKALADLVPRSQNEKDYLAELQRAHKEQVERTQKISSLLDEADFALKAKNPEAAIQKLKHLLDDLDPDHKKAKLMLAKARDLLTRKIITVRIEAFDRCFREGKAGELAEMIDPEQGQLRSEVAQQIRDFFNEKVRVLSAGHSGISMKLDDDEATVEAVFNYKIELTEAGRTVSGSLKRRIELVRRASSWYIAAIKNLD